MAGAAASENAKESGNAKKKAEGEICPFSFDGVRYKFVDVSAVCGLLDCFRSFR